MAGREERLPEPQSGQRAVERGGVSQARRMTNLCPGNRVRYTHAFDQYAIVLPSSVLGRNYLGNPG